MNRSSRRWKNFLIYREHQLRYAGQMALVAAVLTAGLGWMIYHFNSEASRVCSIRALDPQDIEAQALKVAFDRGAREILLGLLGFGIILSTVLGLWQIVTSHKVAGPLYYVAHQARRVRDGYLGKLHPLRKGDMLHGFFETFREMHEALRGRAQKEAEAFARLAAAVEKAGLADAAAELRSLQREREQSLQDPSAGQGSNPG